ncbi:glycosyltransferase family 4 protein [Brevibacillus laterosporus]|uniref:glycosyltransferase family 4 protein n=1 Tax=Brevibacillus laterosporus TaxID=1465 RepID=UPI00264DCA7F|nr:glycosyltransferase family 4 protein [Brevibacillus laterosporus]MDN9008956.1 glycosyltransferase family 4 protein [Brevibacillus laterosporus]MDO0941063.1 glycosyltransferase family 4 protein [Brevibacillus laterosporus]
MRIAIISPGPFSVPPVRGSSVELDIDEVSKRLALSHDIEIYTRTCKDYPRSERDGRIKYIRISYLGQKSYIKQVASRIKKNKPDLILIENRPSFVSIMRKACEDIPIVLNMHSHVFASRKVISPLRMKKVKKQVDCLITNSNYLRRYLIKKHGIAKQKIHAVHLGVDVATYSLSKEGQKIISEKRKSLGYQQHHRVMMYAGRLMHEKGVHLLIRAFKQIAKRDQHARLLIVGGKGYGNNQENKYVRYLKKLAKPLKEKVRFVNFIPSKQMPEWYHICDIVATPSVWNEPFCRVNIEGMAAGKPILTSTKGGIGEVVEHNETGYLIPPKEWVKTIPDLWEQMWNSASFFTSFANRSILRASEFTWEKTANEYLEVFNKAIKIREQKKQRPRKKT